MGSDAQAMEKKEEAGKASMLLNDSADDMKKTQDLAKLSLSLDEIKQQLKVIINTKNWTSAEQNRFWVKQNIEDANNTNIIFNEWTSNRRKIHRDL